MKANKKDGCMKQEKTKIDYLRGQKQDLVFKRWKERYHAKKEELEAHLHSIFAHEGEEGAIL